MTLDLTKIAFTSQYPVDKVVATYTGSFTVTAGGSGSTTVTHNLNKKCFTEMIYNIDGTNYQDAGQGIVEGSDVTVALPVADTNSITIYGGTTKASNQTVNYVLYVIWPN